jgi:hypothetical protein
VDERKQEMSHVKHLRVETALELAALEQALEYRASSPTGGEMTRAASALLERLRATPVARNGGIVHVEDATLAPSGKEPCG